MVPCQLPASRCRQIPPSGIVAGTAGTYTLPNQCCCQVGVTDMVDADDTVVGALASERASDVLPTLVLVVVVWVMSSRACFQAP